LDTVLDTAVRYGFGMGMDHLIAAFVERPERAPLAEGVVLEDFGQCMVYRGRAAVLAVLSAFFGEGFPDGRMCVEATLSEKQMVVIAFVFCGRQERVFLGLPATGREVAVPMILLFRVAQQCIEHIAWYYDAGTILRQLGLGVGAVG
jgi:steroid delta-isomerase-like uncharacterized protein